MTGTHGRQGRPGAADRRRVPGVLAGPALALVLALAGCTGAGGEDGEATGSAPPPSAAERLEQAREVLLEAGAVSLTLQGEDLPEDGSSYIISAGGAGSMEPPAFEGTITARISGIQADVPTIAVDGDLWVQLPYVSSYVNTDPADLGVPDPAALFHPETGLVGLLPQTQDPQFGDRVRAGAETVQQVTGTLPGEAVTALLYAGDAEADFDVVYGLLEEDWEVRSVSISGPFYPPETSTYLLTLADYGAPVTVTAP
jgi:lipoprotein LprG